MGLEPGLQTRLRDMGFNVKVLSLFFIDSVASFRADDGLVRTLFIKAFDEAKQAYPEWQDRSALDVQASYFASKVNKKGEVTIFDKPAATTKDERDAQAREPARRNYQLVAFSYCGQKCIFVAGSLYPDPDMLETARRNRAPLIARARRLESMGLATEVEVRLVNAVVFVRLSHHQFDAHFPRKNVA